MAPTAEEISSQFDLTGKVALISGATSGIGRETARVLVLRNCKVLLGARNLQKGNEVKAQLIAGLGQDRAKLIEVVQLDLGTLAAVRDFGKRFQQREDKRLDILINNAGILNWTRETTPDGFEAHFGVNHLAPFLLTLLVLPYLKATAEQTGVPSRVVNVSSLAHTFIEPKNFTFEDYNSEKIEFSAFPIYGASKLANILTARELNDRLSEISGANQIAISNSLHPGAILTSIVDEEELKNIGVKLDIVSIPEGAATQVLLAGSPDIKTGGEYYDNLVVGSSSELAQSRQLAKQLWEISERLVGLTFEQALNSLPN